jgi:hypothetical protein
MLAYSWDHKEARIFVHYTCPMFINRPRMLGQMTLSASHSLPTFVFPHSILAQANKTKSFVASKRYHLIISVYTE